MNDDIRRMIADALSIPIEDHGPVGFAPDALLRRVAATSLGMPIEDVTVEHTADGPMTRAVIRATDGEVP